MNFCPALSKPTRKSCADLNLPLDPHRHHFAETPSQEVSNSQNHNRDASNGFLILYLYRPRSSRVGTFAPRITHSQFDHPKTKHSPCLTTSPRRSLARLPYVPPPICRYPIFSVRLGCRAAIGLLGRPLLGRAPLTTTLWDFRRLTRSASPSPRARSRASRRSPPS